MMQIKTEVLSIPSLAASLAAGFLIALIFIQAADKDLDREKKTCKARVELVKIISSLKSAIGIIRNITYIAEKAEQLGIDIAAIINGEGINDTDAPIEYATGNERKKLDKLIADYEVNMFVPGAESVKKELRDKILVQTCSTLKGAAPVRDRIPDYDKLVELFCNSFPPT